MVTSFIEQEIKILDKLERKRRTSNLLNAVLLVLMTILALFILIKWIVWDFTLYETDIFLISTFIALLISFIVLRRGYTYLASIVAIVITFSAMFIIALTDQGVRDNSVIVFLIIIFFATLLLGRIATFVTTFVALVLVWTLIYLQHKGLLIPEEIGLDSLGRDLSAILILTGALAFYYTRVSESYVREVNESRLQLKKVNTDLKKRNAEIQKVNKRLEKSTKKAEESDRLKTAFLANLSHEIRTPMNGIVGFSNLAVSPKASIEQKEEYNRIIANSCYQLLDIVNDIVDISKIESGSIEVTPRTFALNSLMDDQYTLFSMEAEKKGLKLSYDNALKDEQATIFADDTKLKQVLNNLISNAIKFTRKGEVKFGYKLENKELKFTISDTGRGIEEDKLDRVFDRFVQADIEADQVTGGTGLGLSIAKAYVEMMGGRISVKSAPGEGSTFDFTLPYQTSMYEEQGEIITGEDYKHMEEKRVLIVEDVDHNVRLLKEVLYFYPFEVDVAMTGQEALSLAAEKKYDLILMDIKLPDISGIEVTRTIRETDTNTVIIAQTAYAFENEHKSVIDAGCNDLITKPIIRSKLEMLIQTYFAADQG